MGTTRVTSICAERKPGFLEGEAAEGCRSCLQSQQLLDRTVVAAGGAVIAAIQYRAFIYKEVPKPQ